jgi:glycosyltransferase involved in cell wall biosynthesis
MSRPALTILTPSLNHGRFIGAAVDSACPRQDISFEHLVIDGGSSDETAEVLAARPRLDVHVRPELDSHEALNFGLARARGEVVGFLNADDRYDAGALDAVMDIFATRPAVEAVCGGMRFFHEEAGVEKETRLFMHRTGEEMALELTFGNPGFNSWFFRRGLLGRLGGFRPTYRFAADRDLLLRLYALTTPLTLPRIVYHYRVHEGSRTMDPRGTNRQAMIQDELAIIRDQSAEIWRHDPRMLTMLANWAALEQFKLVVRAILYRTGPVWSTLRATPWHRVPAALYLRRRWLRILFGHTP